MACALCESVDPVVDRLGYCGNCHNTLLRNIDIKLVNISNNIIYWMGEAEKRYRKSIRYSEDLPDGSNVGVVGNGVADCFLATGKNFVIRGGVDPAAAIRAFICGSNTVCECQGLLVAVMYNAVLDAIGQPTFNLTFQGLEITTSIYGVQGKAAQFISVVGTSEDIIREGDWVYLKNFDMSGMTEKGLERSVSSAAGGWNLICTAQSPPKMFSGLGLTDNPGSSECFTFDTIKQKMTGNYVVPLPVLSRAEMMRRLKSGEKIPTSVEKQKKPTIGPALTIEKIKLDTVRRLVPADLKRLILNSLRLGLYLAVPILI